MLAAMMIGTVTTTHAQTETTLNEPETKQTLEVNGYVTGKKGEPLMGVVVQVKGTKQTCHNQRTRSLHPERATSWRPYANLSLHWM